MGGPFLAEGPTNFREAKTAAKEIHRDHRLTFYCGCHYDKHGQVDLGSCGYKIQRDKRRAQRLEWEHIMPASVWGQPLACWRQPLCCPKEGKCYKGRQCCQTIDPQFSKMEADLHNLVPEIGELNALRSNYRFGELPNIKAGQFGLCEFKIDNKTRRVEPHSEVKGTVARAYLYMAAQYGIHLSDAQHQLCVVWNRQYPPDEWEIQWDNRVADIQGNHNIFISQYQEHR